MLHLFTAMRILLTLVALIIALPGFAQKAEPRRQQALSVDLSEPRCSLKTNTPAIVFRELNDPIIPLEIAKAAELEVRDAFEVVAAGDDDNGQVVLMSPESAQVDAARFVECLAAYVRMRRAGVSSQGCLRILRMKRNDAGSDYDPALRARQPWLRFDLLQPVENRQLAAFPWIDQAGQYWFSDPEVVYLVGFDEKKSVRSFYALDPVEFLPQNAEHFARARTVAMEDLNSGSVLRYWKRLKAELKKQGIDWISPQELNPEILWH
jgi:hypothetical protein